MRRVEPVGGEAGPIEIRAGKTPQHRAIPCQALPSREPAEDAGNKGGGDGTILLVAIRPEDLVQSSKREPAARQYPIDRGNTKRQDPMDRRGRPLDPSDALAQLGKKSSFLDHVLFLFFISFLSMPG